MQPSCLRLWLTVASLLQEDADSPRCGVCGPRGLRHACVFMGRIWCMWHVGSGSKSPWD